MKKEIDIWTIIEGELLEIKDNDQIYQVRKKQEQEFESPKHFEVKGTIEELKPKRKIKFHSKESPQEKTAETKKHLKTLGVHFMGKHQKMRMIKEAIDELWNKDEEEAIEILRKYYPNVKEASLRRYYQTYSAFMNKIKSKKEHPRGKKIMIISKQSVYENPYNAVKELIASGKSSSKDIILILVKYYPMYQKKTIQSLASVYRRAVTGKRIRKEYTWKKNREKSEKYKPDDAIGWSKTYHIWIKKDEYHNMYKKITAINYTDKSNCTTETLAMEMGMTAFRTRAVLNYMLEQGKIKQSYNEDGKPTYHP